MVFKELRDIGNMEFRFAEEQPPDDYASELAGNLLVYPPEHVTYGDYSYEVWDKEMINYLLNFFKPGNMRVEILSKNPLTKHLTRFQIHHLQDVSWMNLI